MKVAFLDRDGTIIHDYEDEYWKFIIEPEFISGAIEALKIIDNLGYKIIILTNQYIINSGIITFSQYEAFTYTFIEKLKQNDINILDIFFCPHSKLENCNCQKPKTGLYNQAIQKYPSIEKSESFLVGDSLCDIELGNRIGIKTFGIKVKTNKFNYVEVKSLEDVTKYLHV